MGFLDALRNWGGTRPDDKLAAMTAMWDRMSPAKISDADPAADPETVAQPSAASPYDRQQWRKKLKRILQHLPRSEPDWADLQQEAGALDLGADWVATAYFEEFSLLIHKIVADRVVTSEEHHNLDLARSLMGITDAEAETLLHAIVAEAEAFFGKKVEGA